jgi:peptide/nickel transport system ATP-binding protein
MLLSVRDLHVSLPDQGQRLRAVRGVDLDVAEGETLCLVGESGCGKSMTALALMQLLPRGAELKAEKLQLGDISLVGLPERKLSGLRGRRMSMIFQEPMTALNPVFTIGDQLRAVYRRHTGVGKAAAQKRAIEVLESVGLTNAALRLGQYPHQLSGGLRQRVLIAMALMCEPEMIICDEPTTALDVTTQAQILRILKDAQASRRMGMIFITHDLGVVARVADRVAVMYAGRIVEEGARAAVLQSPAHPYTRGLIASVPRPQGAEPGTTRLASIPGNVPAFHREDARCPFLSRCPKRMDVCGQEAPPVRQAPSGQKVVCHLPIDAHEALSA